MLPLIKQKKDCYSEYMDFLSTGPHWAVESPQLAYAFYGMHALGVCEALYKFSKKAPGDARVFSYREERQKLEQLSSSGRLARKIDDKISGNTNTAIEGNKLCLEPYSSR
ncbi:MAG: hypothetical protein LBO73_03930 [Holosporaceae bacterium]|jgi:hypothetical protein|nr:hypothetical protein [Holosporaceae bacterium]